jgi:hypothetical protein
MWKSAGRVPSLRVIPWHLSYIREKKHGKTSVKLRKTSVKIRKTSVRLTKTSVREVSSSKLKEAAVGLRK